LDTSSQIDYSEKFEKAPQPYLGFFVTLECYFGPGMELASWQFND
jgi:hypothetical protein